MTGNPGGPMNLAENRSARSHAHGRRQSMPSPSRNGRATSMPSRCRMTIQQVALAQPPHRVQEHQCSMVCLLRGDHGNGPWTPWASYWERVCSLPRDELRSFSARASEFYPAGDCGASSAARGCVGQRGSDRGPGHVVRWRWFSIFHACSGSSGPPFRRTAATM